MLLLVVSAPVFRAESHDVVKNLELPIIAPAAVDPILRQPDVTSRQELLYVWQKTNNQTTRHRNNTWSVVSKYALIDGGTGTWHVEEVLDILLLYGLR